MVKCTKSQVRRLKTALYWKGDPARRQRIQMVLLREGGMTQPSIAAAMGVSLSTVNRAHMAYDGGGLAALKSKPSGGRKRQNMTLAEEKALLARFAKAAGAGELLNIHDIKAPMIEHFGGRYLTRVGAHEVLEGNWRPNRVVVIEFPDIATMKALYHSPEYQPLIALRQSAATDVIIVVDGK